MYGWIFSGSLGPEGLFQHVRHASSELYVQGLILRHDSAFLCIGKPILLLPRVQHSWNDA